MGDKHIRRTESVCPVCIKTIAAEVIEADGSVYLQKTCAEHGTFKVLLSRHPDYWRDLNAFYFALLVKSLPQRDYIIRLTDRCNMECCICLASANERPLPDLPVDQLAAFLHGKKRYKVDLMGAEPTVRDDLPEIIRLVEQTGNIAALHTNGLKIVDRDYLAGLQRDGLREVHLQFDTFSDDAYNVIRGMPLVALKEKVLENLKSLNIATDLVVTILRGVNERDMIPILEMAANPENSYIKEVFYLGCRFLGRATDFSYERCLMPDEVIDFFTEQLGGRITREHIRLFQKVYFTFLHFWGKRKCFYIHHYLVIRDGRGGYIPIHELLDLKRMEPKLERYRRLADRRPWLARLYLLAALTPLAFNKRFFTVLREGVILKALLVLGFDLSKIPSRAILLGFITACDPYMMDLAIAANCGKGELSMDLGRQDSGSWANVLREKLFLSVTRRSANQGQETP